LVVESCQGWPNPSPIQNWQGVRKIKTTLGNLLFHKIKVQITSCAGV